MGTDRESHCAPCAQPGDDIATSLLNAEVDGQRLTDMEFNYRVVMFYPSANRDDSRFAEPDRFDMRRTPNPHLGFGGGGTHFCLARIEATALLREVLARMKNLEPAGPGERTPSATMNSLRTMPGRFTPTD